MNVFVLCTGRCGSMTFVKAAGHMVNFSSGHETRVNKIGPARLAYPRDHIEVDNRLCWFLGRLERHYGNTAWYVHLYREPKKVAQSFRHRFESGIIDAYARSIVAGGRDRATPEEIGLDYCETIHANIDHFLSDKSHVMRVSLANIERDFARFWEWIGARGDLGAALQEWHCRYNASMPAQKVSPGKQPLKKWDRVIRKLPRFIKNA